MAVGKRINTVTNSYCNVCPTCNTLNLFTEEKPAIKFGKEFVW